MEVGQIVEVKLSKDWVMIIALEPKVVICRTKSNEIVHFNEFELREIK